MSRADRSAPEDPALARLMVAYQQGHADAFDRLHDLLASDLKAYLVGLTRDATRADDLLQETFLQVHRARASHTPGLPVRPWVFAIARRVFLMHGRSDARRIRREDASSAADLRRPSGGREAERLQLRQDVGAALQRVAPDSRRVFVLHHVFGFSFREIGARMGLTPAAAKVRSSRAAGVMRAWLKGGRDD